MTEDPLKILHVEDLQDDVFLIERVLRKSGLSYEIKHADTRELFIDALSEFEPDVILCDHSLPGFSSSEALQILSRHSRRIPFILVTATLTEQFLAEFTREGVDDYILKDRPLRLPTAIRAAISRARLEEKKNRYLEKLKRQERLFRSMIENLAEAIVLIDEDALIIYHSPAATRLIGYSRHEVKGIPIFDFLHPDDLRRAKSLFQQAADSLTPVIDGRFRVRKKNGEYFLAEGTVKSFRSEEDERYFIINYRDVTEKIETLKGLEESEANLRAILNSAETSYVFLDRGLNILSFNQRAADLYRMIGTLSPEAGSSILNYLPEERRDAVNHLLNRALEGERISYEVTYELKEHGKVWFRNSFIPVHSSAEQPHLGVLVCSDDITSEKLIDLEREKMTADLVQHVRNLEQFAYIVSHNLRSPVANIIGLTNMLQGMYSLTPADSARCLEGLLTSAQKLDEIIRDLNHILEVRREVSQSREKVRFSALVRDIRTALSEPIRREHASIKTDFIEADEIFSIRTYLYSIFFNLISNSIKYRNPLRPPMINIQSRLEGNDIVLFFRDNGIGIDTKTYGDKVFGLYRKFHNHVEGKGVGLYLVKTQVEMLGGNIEVRGEVNAGSEFRIRLPVQGKP